MRDPNRISGVMKSVEELWNKYPDWRFMQLICNLQRYFGGDGFYIEDNKFVDYLDSFDKSLRGEG